MGFGVDRDSLRTAAGTIRSGLKGDASPGPASPPNAGRSTPAVTEVIAEAGFVAANANEMATRAAADMDKCVNDYELNDQRISQIFGNLTGNLDGKIALPPPGKTDTRAAGK